MSKESDQTADVFALLELFGAISEDVAARMLKIDDNVVRGILVLLAAEQLVEHVGGKYWRAVR